MIHAGHHSDRGLLRTILQAGGQQPRPVAPAVEALDFDFAVPHRFSRAELATLASFHAEIAEKMSATMSALLGGRAITLTHEGRTECYASALAKADGESYVINLLDDAQKLCGYMSITLISAAGWVARLLGRVMAPSDAGRDLSQLEMVLLMDVITSAVTAASLVFEKNRLRPLRRSDQARKGRIQHATGSDEFVAMSFGCPQSPTLGFDLCISSALLAAVAGENRGAARSPEQLRQELLAHLENLPVKGDVILGTSAVAMSDMLSLQPGDVLLVDKKAHEPLEFVVNGQTLLQGHLCSCQGRYALEICEKTKAKGSAI